MALPTALLAMMVLLMLGGLFVAYAAPQQQVTARSQSFETGLHVAESSVELALAALADPEQPRRPFEAPTSAPSDLPGARTWAVNQALSQVDATCSKFQRTAGGDGIAIVDATLGTVYGVAFLPNCQSRTTTRVMRVAYSVNPLVELKGTVGILAGGDLYLDGSNARILSGGLHSNKKVIGSAGTVNGGYSATGTCSSPCVANSPPQLIPNFTARSFWEVHKDGRTNPSNHPFYELCDDGKIRVSAPTATEPCQLASAQTTIANWSWTPGSGSLKGGTWTWISGSIPPPGQYYAYRSNIESRMNNGNSTASNVSFFAEADRNHMLGSRGDLSGSIRFTSNANLTPSWPGVGIIADVDILIEQNLKATGDATLVFAREQFQIDFNGKYDRFLFIACDQSLASTNFDPKNPYCVADAAASSVNSPIHFTRITKNAEFTNPLDGLTGGTVPVPNLGVTGVSDWEILPG